jgi:cytochrome c oxidase subunit II
MSLLEPIIDAVEPPSSTFQMPVAMSTGAESIDVLFYGIYWFSLVFTIAITAVMLYFVWKYRRRPGVRAAPTKDSTKLELVWTGIPLVLIVGMFHVSYQAYINNAIASEGAMEIRVRGARWNWQFQYPNGEGEGSTMYLPINRPVRLVMSSADVLHSFYVPAFRLKRDTVPGMYSQLAFTPNKLGEAQVFCAEYCGASENGSGALAGHYGMGGKIMIVTQEEFDRHMDELSKKPASKTDAEWGKDLVAKSGCATCHSVDGSAGTGPTWKGIYEHNGKLQDGNAYVADSAYIKESILRPQAKIVAGYGNGNMPAFVFKDEKLEAIISYMKSLK